MPYAKTKQQKYWEYYEQHKQVILENKRIRYEAAKTFAALCKMYDGVYQEKARTTSG